MKLTKTEKKLLKDKKRREKKKIKEKKKSLYLSIITTLFWIIYDVYIFVNNTKSYVILAASLYLTGLLISLLIYMIKGYSSYEKKLKYYKLMAIINLITSIIFLGFVFLKAFYKPELDHYKNYIAYIYAAYLIWSFFSAIITLIKERKDKDILYQGIAVVLLSSSLMDIVICHTVITGSILKYNENYIYYTNTILGLAVAGISIIASLFMLIYYKKKNKKYYKNN